ncbi:ring-cleaving dioxygenase [Saliphagus infecundisoli]|uniref:Ring-cleaving dioxygenase n=1 Tax=Saliphagus infecundisoli TaxID=1849069 RepID=A0ABD5QD86_9EURY|nr:ring-cleaving dioxygenase [Saliphagus infecundisoli]
MSDAVPGIHHVTFVAGDPERNLDFYTEVLGLRLVKKTVNFDDPSTYHLYYGDEVGSPGTILTFFPFGEGRSGRSGRGQATATRLAVPEGSLAYWREHLADRGVDHEPLDGRDGLAVYDPDGQRLELVAGSNDGIEPWDGGSVPAEHAIRGVESVTLHPTDPEATEEVLEELGYERREDDGDRIRFEAPGDRSTGIEVRTDDAPAGTGGPGTVHHVAFRTADDESQDDWRERLTTMGQRVTPRKDRQYFRSIYFREPGGILFEIATDGPGFDRDEPVDALGEELKLPDWLEDDRERIERSLAPLEDGPAEVR